MLLRLLLVSAAVALGFEPNPPAGDDLAQWAQEAQSWCNARMPEMTTVPEPPGEATPVVAAEPAPVAQTAQPVQPAPTTEQASVPTPPVSPDAAFEHAMQGVVGVFVADLHPSVPAADAVEVAHVEAPAVTPEAKPETTATVDVTADDLPRTLLPGLALEVNGAIESLGSLPTPATELFPAPEVAVNPVPAPAVSDLEERFNDWTWTFATSVDEAAEPVPVAVASVAAVESQAAPAQRNERLSQAMQLTGRAFKAWLQVMDAPEVALKDAPEAISR